MNQPTPRAAASTLAPRGLRVREKAANVAAIELELGPATLAPRGPDDVLIEITAAAINPSDAKAATGLMPYAVWPRTPGRDYCGVVIEGPPHLVGKTVFGSSGQLGITRDGSHATHMVVEAAAVVEKPANIPDREAAGIGVPFMTAQDGFRRAGMPKPGETVLIMGLNGKVGQAAAQIATWCGARVIGVVRRPEPYEGHASGPVEVIDSSSTDVAKRVRELTGGKGADLVFNTVGDPYYAAAQASMAVLGKQLFIAAVERYVTFDILAFYKGRHTYIGLDSIAISSVEAGAILRDLLPGFASGALRPYPVHDRAVLPLERAKDGYVAVMGSSRDRVVLAPNG